MSRPEPGAHGARFDQAHHHQTNLCDSRLKARSAAAEITPSIMSPPITWRGLHVLLRELDAIGEAGEGAGEFSTDQRVEGDADRRAKSDEDIRDGAPEK